MNKETTKMKIAIIAWGALLKNSKGLSIGKWANNGPSLPLEFSRVSADKRLTLVIDEKRGEMNATSFAISKHNNLEKAFKELLKKEKININRIGVVNLKTGLVSQCVSRYSKPVYTNIVTWAKKNGVDAVIFAALGPKFKDVLEVKFSPESAFAYVSKLPVKTRQIAKKYIASIPAEIDTPFRSYFNEHNKR